MIIPADIQEAIEYLEALEARRTREVLSLEACEHTAHHEAMFREIAITMYQTIVMATEICRLLEIHAIDAIEWPREIKLTRKRRA